MLSTPFLIKKNVLLRGGEPTLSLADALQMKTAIQGKGASDPATANVASALSIAERVHSVYGEGGLFRLFLLSASTKTAFDHFLEVIVGIMVLLRMSPPEQQHELQSDNEQLPQGADLQRFNSHVMIPSLSRKLYNPGRHHGYLVYGLGGPRILVSHPFRGAKGYLYDVYNNSVDVATSLITRGYHGSFLFLDNLPGLNREIKGVPGWLLWFSMIAAHSDWVVFLRCDDGFRDAQRREIEYTPDRVQKKIVDIPSTELRWAEEYEKDYPTERFFGADGRSMTREEYLEFEAKHAMPLLEQYVNPLPRTNGLIRLDAESGEVNQYPVDYPLYR